MTTPYRTIDNLGVDASRDYALNQKELDRNLIEESRFIPKKTEVYVTSPAAAEMDRKFSIGRITLWAAFAKPDNFETSAARLFTYELMPSAGSLGQLEKLLDNFSESAPPDAKLQKEHRTIQTLLEKLVDLGRTFEQISARRSQYQKG